MTIADPNAEIAAGEKIYIPENVAGRAVRMLAEVDHVEGDTVYVKHQHGGISGPHSAWSLERAEPKP